MNKKLLSILKKNIFKIFKSFNATLIQSCLVFRSFTGRDIDAFYEHQKYKYNFKINKNTILSNRNNNSIRIHLNQKNRIDFLSLDIEDVSVLPRSIKLIFYKNFNKRFFCKKTNLYHFDEKSIIFYKLFKYFSITIHSFTQLKKLKVKIEKLNKNDFNLIFNSIKISLPNEFNVIKKFFFWNFKKFSQNQEVHNFFEKKKFIRNKKRKIFSGKLNFKNILFSKKFLYSLIFGSVAKWNNSHNSMPAIAIVGNDGSGKTTAVEYIRNNFSKMDPLIFDMKASKPFFSFFFQVRKILMKIANNSLIKKTFINLPLGYLGEVIDFFDTYIKYRIGMAWADSGNGVTIFERYPTDRIRGEFPNNNNKFLPLEQFFPFPDGIIYLDVFPKDSIKRKKNDNHTLKEMTDKRKNYFSLIKEFNEYKIINAHENIAKKIIGIKNYIFEINYKKNKEIKINNRVKRVIWNKNFKRVLAGKFEDRVQKKRYF